MTSKTLNVIEIVVALVLLAGIGVGLFFGGRWLIGDSDEIFPADDTTQTDDSQKPSDETQTPSDTTQTQQAFYVGDDGYGYRTIDGVTSFFKRVQHADYATSTTCPNSYVYLYVAMDQIVPYGSFVVNCRYSFDAIMWSEFDSATENGEISHYIAIPGVQTGAVYVSYTFVTNCANPMTVLNDLRANAFDFNGGGEGDLPRMQCGCILPG